MEPYRVFLAPSCIPSFSPVQEMNLSCDSAGDLIVQHDHSDGGRHVPFHLVAAQLLPALPTWRQRAFDGVNVWQELLSGPH